MIRLWLGALLAFLAIAALAVFGPWGDAPATKVIAHRGASHSAPENTIAAITAALDSGADVVEVDVRLTADGVPVLLHDRTLERTTDAEDRLPDAGPWRVADLTLDEIRLLDAGSWKSDEFAGERVPTLDEAILAVGDDAALLIELKGGATETAEAAVVAEALEGPPARDLDVTVQSFDGELLAEFARLAPDVPTAIVTSEALDNAQLRAYAAAHEGVTPDAGTIDEGFVAAAHDLELVVRPYTVNDPQIMRRLIGWGVDGIITDRPDRLRQVLESGR